MLDGGSYYGTVHMEVAKEGSVRGRDGVWFRQTIRYGGKIPLGNPTGTSDDELIFLDAIMPAS